MAEWRLNLLGSLPTALMCDILCDWLDIEHLARVDSAFCVRNARENMLELFRSDEFYLDRTYYPTELDWILLRGIKLHRLQADKSIQPCCLLSGNVYCIQN